MMFPLGFFPFRTISRETFQIPVATTNETEHLTHSRTNVTPCTRSMAKQVIDTFGWGNLWDIFFLQKCFQKSSPLLISIVRACIRWRWFRRCFYLASFLSGLLLLTIEPTTHRFKPPAWPAHAAPQATIKKIKRIAAA